MPSLPDQDACQRIEIIFVESTLSRETTEHILRQISTLMAATGARKFQWEETGSTGSIMLARWT